jgi:hypothetical protein
MASEIRVNKINNRAGLGTVTYTDTGIIVSGIVTANSFKGDGSSLTGIDATALKDTAGAVKIQAQTSGAVHSGISTFSNLSIFDTNSGTLKLKRSNTTNQEAHIGYFSSGLHIETRENTNIELKSNTQTKLLINPAGAVVSGILTATSFSGDGSSLSNLPAGAPVGGASTNTVFFENDKAVAVNYQITSTKNAMSAGPIAINAGIAVTVPSGCSWTIV